MINSAKYVVDCQCVKMFTLFILVLLFGVRIDCLIDNQKVVQWTLTNKNGCKFVVWVYIIMGFHFELKRF